MCFAPQRRALFRHLNFQKWSETVGFWHFWLGNVLRATMVSTFSTSQLPKVVRDRRFLTLLTWKCASRHNGVHFFTLSTSKSALNVVCFKHFDFEMCFAPQRRTLFPHQNFQKCSEPVSFWHFWLGNVLRAAPPRRALFRHLNFQEWSETVSFWHLEMCFAPQRCATFHLSLASWLRTRCFSEVTFRPSGATNHWKNIVNCDLPTFSRTCIFFLLTLSLLWSSLFSSLTLPTSAFPTIHIVGSFNYRYIYISNTVQWESWYPHKPAATYLKKMVG